MSAGRPGRAPRRRWAPRSIARRAAVRALDALDPLLFPPTTNPAEHWLRQRLNEAVAARLDALGTGQLDGAEISGSFHSGREWGSYTSLDYPAFDLCAPLAETERFDVVICEQVLEHVPDPWLAARNLHGLCRPGGRVVVSTPFMVRVHELPQYRMYDYWRFTPRGLRTLLESAGFTVEETGSWGNREAVLGNLRGWSAYRRWHSLANERDIPLQVWAFGTRSEAG